MSKPVLSKTHAESKHLHEVPILSLATMIKSFFKSSKHRSNILTFTALERHLIHFLWCTDFFVKAHHEVDWILPSVRLDIPRYRLRFSLERTMNHIKGAKTCKKIKLKHQNCHYRRKLQSQKDWEPNMTTTIDLKNAGY